VLQLTVEGFDSHIHGGCGAARVERSLEEAEEGGERESVHVIYLGQVHDDKEQSTPIGCQWQEGISFLCNIASV